MGHGGRVAILSSGFHKVELGSCLSVSRLPRSTNNRHRARCVAPVYVVTVGQVANEKVGSTRIAIEPSKRIPSRMGNNFPIPNRLNAEAISNNNYSVCKPSRTSATIAY